MLIIGIDDAGRGPIIGPMILAGVLVTKEQESYLKEIGAKDSKLLTHKKRIELSELIKPNCEGYFIAKSFPEEIDFAINSGFNLNNLEAKKAGEIINKLNTKKDKIKVIVDCPSVNTLAWRNKLLEFIEHKANLEVICEHKADANYPSVSAASILAKIEREIEVEKIKKIHGNIGSGYPSDPYTTQFIKSKGNELKNSGIFRKSWATWKNSFPEDNKNKNSDKQQKLF